MNDIVSKYLEANDGNLDSYKIVEKLCNTCQYNAFIIDWDTRLICNINEEAEKYLGLSNDVIQKEGLSITNQLLHPDFIQVFPLSTAFFSKSQNYFSDYQYIYKFNTKNGSQWTYTCSKIVHFNPDKTPKYIICVFCDINDILNHTNSNGRLVSSINEFDTLEFERFQSLTINELEILRLIAKEHTTIEIAEMLNKSKFTVDFIRKTLLKKLNVKNAIGFAKYIYVFDR